MDLFVLLKRSGPGPLDCVFRRLVPLLCAFLLNGCSTVGYYSQLAEGNCNCCGRANRWTR